MGWLRYANQGATRNMPLSPELVNVLSFLPEMGITAEVFSGGQPHKGSGKPRVGSVRHDHGGAGDIRFYKGGNLLDFTKPDDQQIGAEIIKRARAGGATGIGWGVDYMGPNAMHIGFGAPAVWGAGGKSANADQWLRDAYYGAEQTTAPQMMAQNTRGPRMATKPDMIAGGGNHTLVGGGGNERKGFAGLSPEAWMAISGAFMNMSQPGAGNPQLSAAYGMMGDKRKKTQSAEATNKTVGWLRSQGREDLAAAVESGALDGKSAASLVFSQPKDDRTGNMKDYEYYKADELGAGRAPLSFADWSVLDEKAGLPSHAQVSGDYVITPDEKSPNGVTMTVIPGSETDMKQKAAEAAQGQQAGAQSMAADVVTDAADRAISANQKRMAGGLLGFGASFNPSSQNAEVYRQIDVLRSNARLESLQAMRRASPNGAAMGNLSNEEGKALEQRIGALDPASPYFERDMLSATRALLRTIHGHKHGDAVFMQKYGELWKQYEGVKKHSGPVVVDGYQVEEVD